MSRIPVRDAIAHLAAIGLVAYERNRRVVVTTLKEGDLVELFEMRAVLEGLAARHAARNLTKADFDQLSWLAKRMDQTETSEERWIPVHNEFHELICRRAGQPRLQGEIQRLRQSVEPYVRVLININGAAELRTSRHNKLVKDLLQECTPDNAENLVREHIAQASRAIAASIRSTKERDAGDSSREARKPGRKPAPARAAQQVT
jgi:DNA-binding GntR family transcriptional regulator